MTTSTRLVISTTKEEKSLREGADFSRKVEMTRSNNGCNWYYEGEARLNGLFGRARWPARKTHSGGNDGVGQEICWNVADFPKGRNERSQQRLSFI